MKPVSCVRNIIRRSPFLSSTTLGSTSHVSFTPTPHASSAPGTVAVFRDPRLCQVEPPSWDTSSAEDISAYRPTHVV
eukprot:1181345-Prorocentrum_minimum.AAC.4